MHYGHLYTSVLGFWYVVCKLLVGMAMATESESDPADAPMTYLLLECMSMQWSREIPPTTLSSRTSTRWV